MLNFPTDNTDFHRFTDSFGFFTESQNENPRCLQQEYLCKSVRSVGSLQKNIQEIAWRFRKKVVYLQPKGYKIIGDRDYD